MSGRDLPSAKMRVTSNGLVPVDELGVELLFNYPVGEEVEVTFFQEQSIPLRRLYFAVLDEVYPSTGFCTQSDLAERIKLRLGHVDSYITMADGVAVKSASLSKYDRQELEQFVEAAFALIQDEILPGVDLTEIIESKRSRLARRRK